MIAIWVLISYPSRLNHRSLGCLLAAVHAHLRSQQQHSFVEPTYHWNLWLNLLLLSLLCILTMRLLNDTLPHLVVATHDHLPSVLHLIKIVILELRLGRGIFVTLLVKR